MSFPVLDIDNLTLEETEDIFNVKPDIPGWVRTGVQKSHHATHDCGFLLENILMN